MSSGPDHELATSPSSTCEPTAYLGCTHHQHHSHTHHSHTHNYKPPTAGHNAPSSSLTPSMGMLPTVCEQNCSCLHHHPHHLATANSHYHHHHGMFHHQHMDSNLAGYTSSNSDNNAPNNHNHYGMGGAANNAVGNVNNMSSMGCDCGSLVQEPSLQSGRSSRLISCDENNPSGSEDSGRKCPSRTVTDLDAPHVIPSQRTGESSERKPINRNNEDRKYSNRIEIYSDNTDPEDKIDTATADTTGPPLPPRPPPRPRNALHSSVPHGSVGIRKYVIWCLVCGGFSCLLGIMFLGVYFLLRSYTSTVGYFETVPTFVPATLLMLTGICIMSLARRRNRYSYLIKLSGACGLASALTCALVTVTTTVLHMSRLQALRECEYTQKTRTCTCYSVMIESQMEGVEEGVRFVFDSTADCGVVHGALYSCLRAVFGLSVAGVLVAVFSCMLVYQLLSHERKKMYWEQLELRCRSLYSGQQGPPIPPTGPSIVGTPRGGPCRCCEQCHAHRTAMPSSYPWDGDNRGFWVPGQAGNFYSPNPGGNEMAGQIRINTSGQRNRTPGWSWPRMPWSSSRNESSQNNRFRQTPSSPDSQYGFSNGQQDPSNVSTAPGGYSVIGPGYGVWGPPPPYSDPNSPARRGYQYIHPGQCQQMMDPNMVQMQANIVECHSSGDSHSMDPFCPQQQQQQQEIQQQPHQQQQHHRNLGKRQAGFKTKENYENTDSDGGPRISNTLPIRKTKKRVEAGVKSIGPNNPNQPTSRVNIQNVFQGSNGQHSEHSENEYNEPSLPPHGGAADTEPGCSNLTPNHLKQRKLKIGVENSGFQPIEPIDGSGGADKIMEPTESEVYFADVSSCCNVSVKNDNYYDDANQRRVKVDKVDKEEVDDYLSQRFGKREASVRSRLPFPQMIPEDYEKPQLNIPVVAPRPSLMRKDISRQSMMSVDSGEKTDFTDLSPATPGSNLYPMEFIEPNSSNFVASSHSYTSNEQSSEAHRRSTKNLLAPDAQYEIIKESPRDFETTMGADLAPYNIKSIQNLVSINCTNAINNPKSPKNLNITPIKRQNLGTNISAIIQNLGNSDDSDETIAVTTKSKQIKDCNKILENNDRRL